MAIKYDSNANFIIHGTSNNNIHSYLPQEIHMISPEGSPIDVIAIYSGDKLVWPSSLMHEWLSEVTEDPWNGNITDNFKRDMNYKLSYIDQYGNKVFAGHEQRQSHPDEIKLITSSSVDTVKDKSLFNLPVLRFPSFYISRPQMYTDKPISFKGSLQMTISLFFETTKSNKGIIGLFNEFQIYKFKNGIEIWTNLSQYDYDRYICNYPGGFGDGKWYSIVLMLDKSSSDPMQRVQFYVNGVKRSLSFTKGSGDFDYSHITTGELRAGIQEEDRNVFCGRMRNIKIYNTLISDIEISRINNPSYISSYIIN